MSAMEKFFASLRRLLEPPTQPPAQSTEQATADRPPPLITEPLTPEPAQYRELASQDGSPATPATMPADDVSDSAANAAVPADVTVPADDVSEVRLLLEAVAEAPVAAPEPEAQISEPEAAVSVPEDQVSELPASEDSTAQPEIVGGALVLTLATPATTFTVARSSATLGRGQENTVRLDDFSVSRRHARIAYRGGGYWLSDLGSMGGTWVDGAKLNAPRRIAAGQVIDIGVCRLTVSFAADREPIPTRKGVGKPRSEIAEQARRRR